MTTAIAKIEGPSEMALAEGRAARCKAIVVAASADIQGKRYVQVEGWQALAAEHGCLLGATNVRHTGKGFMATGQLRRMSDGIVLAEAEGYCEQTGKFREAFAAISMAQTRAMSRVGRSAFAYLVIMMKENLCTTTAEEMQAVVDAVPEPPAPARTAPARPPRQPPPGSPVVTFGKNKGRALAELSTKQLEWYANAYQQNADDENKARWRDENQALADACVEELRRKGGSPPLPTPPSGDDGGEPPPLTDEELPF